MYSILTAIALPSLAFAVSHALSTPQFPVSKRQLNSTGQAASGPVVDLGYEVYQGVANASTNLNTFRGVRYAAPPIGTDRWQLPQEPTRNRSQIMPATEFSARCPQGAKAPYLWDPCPDLQNASVLPQQCTGSATAQSQLFGDEDCLFLNVYAPQNKTNLPVVVWIHGGAYGQQDARQDPSMLINANNNSFIGVTIQYRLGAFGFLASDEVARKGTVNAGLYDQHFALQWVQSYISLFGGNPRSVTIAGQSAGGGSVLIHGMSFGGTLGTSLFRQGIAASPFVPQQYPHDHWVPTQAFYAFADEVGCFDGTPFGNRTQTIFECLVGKDSAILQQANAVVEGTGRYGTWQFQAVTDGKIVPGLPSQELLKKKVNGESMLIGNNADEGHKFTPQSINTTAALLDWLEFNFPDLTPTDIETVLLYYPPPSTPDDPNAPLFATNGRTGPTAINQSTFGTGYQQVANNIYAETIINCPSYYLAEAYAPFSLSSTGGRQAYHYQYSIPPAEHSYDLASYFGSPSNFGPADPTFIPSDFQRKMMKAFGNFITTGDPSDYSTDTDAWIFPSWNNSGPMMANLNITGGVPGTRVFTGLDSAPGEPPSAGTNWTQTVPVMDNGKASFEVVDAWAWEGGRGGRCEFWRGRGNQIWL